MSFVFREIGIRERKKNGKNFVGYNTHKLENCSQLSHVQNFESSIIVLCNLRHSNQSSNV